MGEQGDRHRRDEADRRKILARVHVEPGVEAGVDRKRAGVAQQQRVAVGCGARHRAGADRAAAAAAVVDRHGLAEGVGQLLRHHAGHRVDAAAGRIGDHERDVARWKISGVGGRDCQQRTCEGRGRCQRDHGVQNTTARRALVHQMASIRVMSIHVLYGRPDPTSSPPRILNWQPRPHRLAGGNACQDQQQEGHPPVDELPVAAPFCPPPGPDHRRDTGHGLCRQPFFPRLQRHHRPRPDARPRHRAGSVGRADRRVLLRLLRDADPLRRSVRPFRAAPHRGRHADPRHHRRQRSSPWRRAGRSCSPAAR